MSATIQKVEGYYPGSVAYANNNPGNLKYAGQAGATLGSGGFARFPSYQAGLDALGRQLNLYEGRGLTIAQMMNLYAPASDGNDPAGYASTLAAALGVTADTSLRALASGPRAFTGSTIAPTGGATGGGGSTSFGDFVDNPDGSVSYFDAPAFTGGSGDGGGIGLLAAAAIAALAWVALA